MGHLIAQAHLLHGCCTVAAADHGGGIAFCHGLGHSQRACCQRGIFKHAHGAVPHNRFRGSHGVGKQLHAFGADIAAFHIGGDSGHRHDLGFNGGIDGVRESGHAGGIHRQQQLYALGLGLFQHFAAIVQLAVIAQALANLVALCLYKGIGHAAANDQRVDLFQQVGDHIQLVGNLGAAQNSGEGANRIVYGIAQIADLFFHQVAHSGVLNILGHTHGGAVGAVAAAEGIVHISIGQAGQILAESIQVLGFLGAETGVLQQHNIAILHGSHCSLGVFAHHGIVIGKNHGLAQLCGQSLGHRGQTELCLGAVFGLAEMAAQNHLCTVIQQLLNGGQSGIDAVFVGDLAVLHGNIEITANQNFFACVVGIIDRFFT